HLGAQAALERRAGALLLGPGQDGAGLLALDRALARRLAVDDEPAVVARRPRLRRVGGRRGLLAVAAAARRVRARGGRGVGLVRAGGRRGPRARARGRAVAGPAPAPVAAAAGGRLGAPGAGLRALGAGGLLILRLLVRLARPA